MVLKVPFTEPSRQKHSALKDENGVELLLDFGTMYRHWAGSGYIHTHSLIHLFHSNLQSVYHGLPTKPDPGGLPLSHLRTHSPWLDPPQCQAACLAPQRLLTSPLTLFVCGVRELPGKRKLFWFVCVCVYDTQRLKERRRIETSTTTVLL